MNKKQTLPPFNRLEIFVKAVNIKNMSTPALASRVRDILNQDGLNTVGYVGLRHAVAIAYALKALAK